jgi:hypothetical protein
MTVQRNTYLSSTRLVKGTLFTLLVLVSNTTQAFFQEVAKCSKGLESAKALHIHDVTFENHCVSSDPEFYVVQVVPNNQFGPQATKELKDSCIAGGGDLFGQSRPEQSDTKQAKTYCQYW